MALDKDVYQALEDIVGPENITDEPAILDSYAFRWKSELANPKVGNYFLPKPVAVLMPGSTEEVQAIVKTCNRYKIKCKACSTGWYGLNAPCSEGTTVNLDMRRMDRILEIDEKNMLAVVEPYVIGATLQAEAMKVGLNTHIIGAGASCSPLASATSYGGLGPDTIFMGMSPQNLLALEWVTPTGDILRTGSLGSQVGWFCGEGPGPSIRGAFRGWFGALGGLGIFTKAALKLYPWPGPRVMPIEGTIPAYRAPLPENFKCYTLAFPTWEAYFDAYYKIYDAEIGYITHRQFIKFGEDLQAAMIKILSDSTKTLDDLEEMLETPEVQKLTQEMKYSFQIVLAGMTPRAIEYQEKALNEILAETGGTKVAAMLDPTIEKWSFLYLVRLPFKNLNFIFAGGFTGSFAEKGTPDFVRSYVEVAAAHKRKYIAKGAMVDDGGDAAMGPVAAVGGGGSCSLEQFILYDPSDTSALQLLREYYVDYLEKVRQMRLGPSEGGVPNLALVSKEERQRALSAVAQPAMYHWQRKIKEAFDPNDIGDTSFLYLEETGKEELQK